MCERKCSRTFFNWATFTYHSFDRIFSRTVYLGLFYFVCMLLFFTAIFMPLIYARLAICAENLLLFRPLIARLSTETETLFLFGFFIVVSGCVHFCFSSLLFSPSSASQVCRCPSRFFIRSLLLLPLSLAIQSRLLRLPIAIVSFLVVLFCHQPLTRSLQLSRSLYNYVDSLS